MTLTDCKCMGSVFLDADLTGLIIVRGNYSFSNFSDCDLRKMDLSETSFANADLRKCNLENAVMRNGDLTHAMLSGAKLTHADIRGT